jgi:hypothetical protein
LALVKVWLAEPLDSELMDLYDPALLAGEGIPPDKTASRYREITQSIARQAWSAGASGLRWWSTFWGEWHTTVLFTARAGNRIIFDNPVPLSFEQPAVRETAELLGIGIVA